LTGLGEVLLKAAVVYRSRGNPSFDLFQIEPNEPASESFVGDHLPMNPSVQGADGDA
jgi:hypothetical protein